MEIKWCAALWACPIKLEGRQAEGEDRHYESNGVEVQGHGRHDVGFVFGCLLNLQY